MSLADDLRAVRAVIDTPEKWAKEHAAVDEYGMAVDLFNTHAVRFCIVGALGKTNSGVNTWGIVRSALTASLPRDFDQLALFNDHPDTTHDDVMALFDRAIERAEA